jgi:hypothetical protein
MKRMREGKPGASARCGKLVMSEPQRLKEFE